MESGRSSQQAESGGAAPLTRANVIRSVAVTASTPPHAAGQAPRIARHMVAAERVAESGLSTAIDEAGPEVDPITLFGAWLAKAEAAEINDPNAMALATSDSGGFPDVRIVLLKDFDQSGFVFYTNTGSSKGHQLAATKRAAAVLHWKSLRRQVRIRGPVEFVTADEANEYFSSRPRISRLSAWASRQSRPLPDRQVLDEAIAELDRAYSSDDVPRPAHWTGYRIVPHHIEFWREMPFRLHHRVLYTREHTCADWSSSLLYP
jgi:pyridoxamine 5'-phosphate oxidase